MKENEKQMMSVERLQGGGLARDEGVVGFGREGRRKMTGRKI